MNLKNVNLLPRATKKKCLPSLLCAFGAAVALSFGLATSAGATTINGGLTSGVLNTIEDQNREAYVDVDRSGTISVGDVLIGYVRIDNFLPAGLAANNQVYAVLSNQITGFFGADPTQVILGVTTAAGLRLQDITGDVNTAGGLVAIYDRGVPFTTDLILTSALGATQIKNDIDLILAQGTLRLVAGLGAPTDYLHVDTLPGFGVGDSNVLLGIAPVSTTFANFGGGLSFSFNNTNFIYSPTVATLDPFNGALVLSQLGIANGALRGAVGDGNESVFANIGTGYGAFIQCVNPAGGTRICGMVSDADFFVRPFAVPEPGSLALLGAALMALTGLRRRSTKT